MRRVAAGIGVAIALGIGSVVVSAQGNAQTSAAFRTDLNHVSIVDLTGAYDRLPEADRNREFAIRQAAVREFLRTHTDDYDFVVAFTNFDYNLGNDPEGSKVGGRYYAIKNDVRGIGQTEFDESADWGSTGQLQGFIDMGPLARLVTDPSDPDFERTLSTLTHEVGHRWGAFLHYRAPDGSTSSALLGRDSAHWNFLLDSGNSVLYGNQWRDNGNGTFTSIGRSRSAYSPLDQYVMGLVPKTAVPPMTLVQNVSIDPTRLPESGVTVSGASSVVTIDQVIAAEGERQPAAANAQKRFKIAFLLLTRPGDRVDGARLEGINSIRDAFATRMTILTNGQALVQVFPEETPDTPEAPGPALPGPGDSRPGPVDSTQGIAWLLARQRTDGLWGDSLATRVRDTGAALEMLAGVPAAFMAAERAKAALVMFGDPGSNDSLARQLAALGTQAPMGAAASLRSTENPSGGWGLVKGQQSNPLDTALALLALPSDTAAAATAYLVGAQNADGGWSVQAAGPSSVLATLAVLRAAGGRPALTAAASRALSWLAARQNADGGFGDNGSTSSQTALAVQVFLAAQTHVGDLQFALDYLRHSQRADGSWDESVYATALAVQVLKAGDLPNATAVSVQLAPSSPVDSQVVTITARIRNESAADLSNVIARLSDGDPGAGLVIGDDIVIASLKAHAEETVTRVWDTTDRAGAHTVVMTLDPANQVQEYNEADNVASASIVVRPPPQNADLAVSGADLALTPASLQSVPQSQGLTARITNTGRTAAQHAAVALYEGSPSSGGRLISTQTVDVPARGSANMNFAFDVQSTGLRQYFVALDPDNQVAEADETNNQASVSLAVQPNVDLYVAPGSVTFSSNPVALAQNVTVSGIVGNRGTTDAFAARVRFFIDDPAGVLDLGIVTIDIPAGQTRPVSVVWRTSRAVANLPTVVQVDPANAFPETSETNNQASALLSVPPATGPNLQISHTALTVTEPVNQGGTTTVSVPVHNAGLADATEVGVAFFVGVPGAGGLQIGATQVVPILASGAQALVSVEWSDIATSGNKLIYAVVDAANTVEEYDEDDNTAFVTVHVRSLPDLVISSGAVSFMPSFPREGDSVALMATIVNTGEQPAANVRVRILNGDPAAGGLQVGSERVIPLIAGGSDESVLVPVDGQAQPGATRLYVQVDPANEIRESSETNNVAGATLGVQDSSLFFSNLYFSPNGDGIQDTTDFFFRLTDGAAASVAVKDRQGRTVRVLPLESPIDAGSVSWDGRDDRGAVVPDGSYSFALLSTDARELGSASCTVDNNASPVADAIGTKFFDDTNLTCSQPSPDPGGSTQFFQVGWLPDDSALVQYFQRQSYCDYTEPFNFNQYRCTWHFANDPQTGVYLTRSDGERTRITPDSWTLPTDLRQILDVKMSPDGSRLFVQTSRYEAVYVQATQCSIFGCFPLGFYNGRFNRIGPIELWTMNTDGSGLTPVGNTADEGGYFQFAPDGNSFVTHGYTEGLRIVQSDGSGAVAVDGTALDGYLGVPTRIFSNDSSKLAYTSYDPSTSMSRLFVANADGTNRRAMDLEFSPSDWTWIGNDRLALLQYVGNNNPDLRVVNVPGTGALTTSTVLHRIGSWVASPDATTIAYTDHSESYSEVLDQVSTGVWTLDRVGNISQLYNAAPKNRGISGLAWNANSTVLSFVEQVTTESRTCMYEGPYFCGDSFAVVGRLDLDGSSVSAKLFPVSEPAAVGLSSDQMVPVGLFPDGHSYLFTERIAAGQNRLVAASLVDGTRTVVLDDPNAYGFQVTPSGRHVTYQSARDALMCRPGVAVYQDSYLMSSMLNLTASFTLQRDRSQLLLNGTAEDRNFKDFRFEYAPAVAGPLQWSPIGTSNDVDVINGPLATWIPPSDGSFYVRLTGTDKAGNELSSRKRVSWGLTPTITNVTVSPRMFSPNADGVNDAATVNYLVLGPVHIDTRVVDTQGHTVRTISQSHASIGPASFAWDGRDDAGAFVPDGQYHIDLLDYRFFVTVDRAPPAAALAFGSAFHTLAQKTQCLDVNGHPTCSLVTGPLVDIPFSELTGRAFDLSLARWRLERGQGVNPSSWVPVSEGTDVLAARDNSGAVQQPIADTGVRRLDDPADIAGAQYRLTVTDQAGNTSVAVSGLAPQEIVIHGWDHGVVLTGRVLEQQPGSHVLSVWQTMRVPIEAMLLQYRAAGASSWINGPAIASREHRFDFTWDNSALAGGHTYDVRLQADDVEGNHVASNVFQIHSDLFVMTSFDKEAGRTSGQASLRESLTSIRLVTASQPETDIGAGGAAFSDAVNFMIPVAPDSTMSACLASSVSARYKGIGETGTVYYSNALTVIRRGSKPAVCSSPSPTSGLDVRVQTLAASQCGMPNPERVVINVIGSGVQADSVKLFIQDSPNGLLREVPNVSLPYSTEIDTHGRTEGMYLVRATGLTIPTDGAAAVPLADVASFIVDRAPPTAEINYPGPNQSLCAVKTGTQSLVNFEGVADDPNFDHYTIDIGVGATPQSWTRVFPATNADVAASRSPRHGILAAWDTGNITRGTYTVRLQVFDRGGNVSCATVTFFFEGGVRLQNVAANQKLISPNGDGLFDGVGVSFALDVNALVDAKVYPLVNGQPASVPVRTLLGHATLLAGVNEVLWDGYGDLGMVVPDGKYRIVLEAFDVCGNSVRSTVDVEVDTTAPEAAITAPQSTDAPGVLQEIRGTANDLHFDHFVVEVGEGAAPVTWTLLARGSSPVIENLLAKWNNRGTAGDFTIRLSAYDRVSNQRIALVPISVPQRPLLVTSFSAEPTLFSPNGDGKLDTTGVAYETGETAHIVIQAIDGNGAVAATLSDVPIQPPGMYTVTWNGESSPGTRVPDGDYKVRIVATAASDVNRTQTENATVRVDTTPPTLTTVMPADMSVVGAHFNVIGTITDPNLDAYTVAYEPLGGGLVVLDEGRQNRVAQSFGALDLEAGSYSLTFAADDLAQNHAGRTITFVVDDTAPQTAINVPEAGAVVGGSALTVDVRGAVTDANLDHWTLRFGVGSEPDTWTTIASGTTASSDALLAHWNLSGVADGAGMLSLQGTDKAGATSEARVPVIVDTTAPVATLTSLDGVRLTMAADIAGVATDANFKVARLEFSAGNAASAFQFATLTELNHAVASGTLFAWQALPPDGTYTLRLTVEDAAGLTTRALATVAIDTHPPSPATNLTATVEGGHDSHLHWTAPVDDDVTGFFVYRDGVRVNATVVPAGTNEYVDQNLGDGTHGYVVKAVDGSGLESAPSNQASVQIDSTPPLTRISAPVVTTLVSGLVDVRGTAAASDLREYRVFAVTDGGAPMLVRRSPVPITNGLLAEWNTAGFAEGTLVTIRLEAEDLTGNSAFDQVTVRIDNLAPQAPALLSAVASGSNVAVQWQTGGETDLAGVLLYNNDLLANAKRIVNGSISPYLLSGSSFNDQGLRDATYRYYAFTVDKAGNFSDRSNVLTVVVETRPPSARIIQPATGTEAEHQVALLGSTTDVDVASYQFQYRAIAGGDWINLGAPVTVPQRVFDLDGLAYGSFEVRVVATDTHGNVDPAPASIVVAHKDLTPPAVPSGGSARVNGGTVSFTWTANTDADLAGYRVYRRSPGGNFQTISPDVTVTRFDDADLPDGIYDYAVTAVDTTGNESGLSVPTSAQVYGPVLATPASCIGDPHLAIAGSVAVPGVNVTLYVAIGGVLAPVQVVQAAADGSFSFTAVTLSGGPNHFAVQAGDQAGNFSKQFAFDVAYTPLPGTPEALRATVLGSRVSLQWNSTTEPIEGYSIHRDGLDLTGVRSVMAGATASASSSYFNAYPASNAIDGNPDTYWIPVYYQDPAPAWQLTLPSAVLITQVHVSWYPGYEADYDLQAWNGTGWTTIRSVTDNSSEENVLDIESGVRTAQLRLLLTNWDLPLLTEVSVSGRAVVTGTAFDDLNVAPGRHTYAVSALNSCLLPGPPATVDVAVGDVTPPAAPNNLTASVNRHDVSLTWSANPEMDVAGYDVYRTADGTTVKLTDAPVTSPAYVDSSRPNGTYAYHVIAVDTSSNGSTPSNVAVAIVDVVVGAPQHLTAAAPAAGRELALAWQPGPDATAQTSYSVYRAETAGGPYSELTASPITALSYRDLSVLNGVLYFYVVRAVDAVGDRSGPSNETSGTAADSVPPDPPIITSPTDAAHPLVVDEDRVDIGGLSEGGAQVTLIKEGTAIATAVALTETVQTFDLPEPWGRVDVAGRLMASFVVPTGWQTQLALTDLDTRTTTYMPNVTGGWGPVFSADGSRIVLADQYGQYGLRVIERASGAQVQSFYLPDSANSYSFSPSGDRVGVVTGGYILLGTVATGDLTQVTSTGYGVQSFRWIDNHSIAYLFEDCSGNCVTSLNRVDLDTGIVMVVDGHADDEGFDISPDGRTLAYASTRGGSLDLWLYDLTTARSSNAVAVAGGGRRQPLFSRDGGALVYSEDDGNEETLHLVQRSTGKAVDLHIVTGNDAVMAPGLRLLQLDDESHALTQIQLPGWFEFASVPLEIGANVYSAIAADTAGNTGVPSDAIALTRSGETAPDLIVTSNDLVVYPVYPLPGGQVRLSATVRNAGAGTAHDVAVMFFDEAAGGTALQPIGSVQTIATIPGGGHAVVSADWLAPASAGRHSISVSIDPGNTIAETSEVNNTAARDAFVTPNGEPAVTLSLDRPGYEFSDSARISVGVANPGTAADFQLDVVIEDPAGNRAALVAHQSIAGLTYSSRTFALTWPVSSVLAGQYRARAILTRADGHQAQSVSGFTVIASESATAVVTTDKVGYLATERAVVTGRIRNTSPNAELAQVSATVQVLDDHGAGVFNATQPVGTLFLDADAQLQVTTPPLVPGDYTVRLTVRTPTRDLAQQSSAFRVDGVEQLTGQLTLTPPLVGVGQSAAFTATIRNAGSLNVGGGQLRVVMVDPSTQTQLRTLTRPLDLAIGGSTTWDASILTGGLAMRSYNVLLLAETSTTTTLASATLTIQDREAPTVQVTSPANGAFVNAPFDVTALGADDASGIDRLEVSVDQGPFQSMPPADAAAGRFGARLDISNVADGVRTLTVRGWDKAGNGPATAAEDSNPVSVSVTIDRTPPQVSITGVADGAMVNVVVTPAIEVSDVNLLNTEMTLDGVPYVSGTAVTSEQDHLLDVTARDRAGNQTHRAVRFTIDRTAPSIVITGVNEGAIYTAPVTAQVAVTDTHTFTQNVLLNGLPYQSGTPLSESGTFALAVFATDAAGNVATAEVHFTIQLDAPPVGQDQDVTTSEDTPVAIALTAVTNRPGLTFAVKSAPAHGALTGVAPHLTYTPAADFNGLDSFTYTVSDATRTSDPATVRIAVTPVNDPPDADAGRDQNAVVGTGVTLDGTASHDRDGNVITYRWMFVTIPAASGLTQTSLMSATSARPFFTPDVPGPYTLSLVVNDGQLDSQPDTVVVQAAQPANVPPNANAGPDQQVPAGSLVHLSGAASADPDNGPQPLSYAWRFVSVPPASQLTNGSFQTPFSVTTTFIPDVAGDYVVGLTVSDGSADAVDDVRVTATASNTPPVASAGPDSMVMLGQAASLDGSASYDPDRGPQPLAYTWTFVSKPSGSCLTNASITNAHAARASFVPDADGIYVLSLSVTDGASSASDNVAITVNSSMRASGEAWFIHDGVEERLSLDVTVVAGVVEPSSRLKYYHPKPTVELVPPRIESMTVSGNTATITGVSTGHDTSGYRVIATVVDGAPDAFGITLLRPNETLAYQYSKAAAGGDLRIWFSSGHSSSDHSNEGKDRHHGDDPPVCAPVK